MDLEYVREASTTYGDWTGTAAAEDSAIIDSGDLYELAGLDRDRWQILAVDITAFSHGAPSSWDVHVYALDNHEHGISSFEDLQALEAKRGSLPVVDILLHDVDLEAVVRCMKVVHFQLRRPYWQRLDRVDKRDFPIQD